MFKKSLALLLSLLLAASPIANAAIPTAMQDMSTTAASNTPAGSESPTNADDYLRAIQAILRSTNAKGSDIASASTIDLGAATGEFVDVTGTTTITSLGTVAAGIVRTVRFTGALTLTHNATSLILPGSANITTANGDVAQFRSLGSGNWKCVGYIKQSGTPVALADGSVATAKLADGAVTFAKLGTDAITGATEDTSPDRAADYALIYDASATALKKTLLNKIGGSNLGTAVSASGSSVDFTSIPAGTKKVTIALASVSTNGTASVVVQIGDSGGVETSGYLGAVIDDTVVSNFSGGFSDNTANAATVRHAVYILTLVDAATNTWACTFNSGFSNTNGGRSGAGTKALSATLDRVRITTGNGTDTFDSGTINIIYE